MQLSAWRGLQALWAVSHATKERQHSGAHKRRGIYCAFCAVSNLAVPRLGCWTNGTYWWALIEACTSKRERPPAGRFHKVPHRACTRMDGAGMQSSRIHRGSLLVCSRTFAPSLVLLRNYQLPPSYMLRREARFQEKQSPCRENNVGGRERVACPHRHRPR